jgi:hypothetical protein
LRRVVGPAEGKYDGGIVHFVAAARSRLANGQVTKYTVKRQASLDVLLFHTARRGRDHVPLQDSTAAPFQVHAEIVRFYSEKGVKVIAQLIVAAVIRQSAKQRMKPKSGVCVASTEHYYTTISDQIDPLFRLVTRAG